MADKPLDPIYLGAVGACTEAPSEVAAQQAMILQALEQTAAAVLDLQAMRAGLRVIGAATLTTQLEKALLSLHAAYACLQAVRR